MSEERTLESIVDPFVKRLGGERVSDIIGNINPQASADYLFRRYGVIAELKSVQAGTFTEPFRRKLTNLLNRWQREGKVIVYGTAQLNSSQLPAQCREELFSAMAESLQKHIVAAANVQIRSTKKLLNMPDAKGLLWVASDGNEYFQPHVLSYLLKRILKKTVDGQPAYSSLNGLAYFSPRMLTQMPGVPEPVILWVGGCRQPDSQLQACLDEMAAEWPRYVSWAQGIDIRYGTGEIEAVRFRGVNEAPLQIRLGDADK